MDDDRTLTRPISNLLQGQDLYAASLLVLSGTSLGKMLKLSGVSTVIGRSPQATLPLDDEGVSRHHVSLSQTDDGVVAEDLNSKNGTLLNGEPLRAPRRLKNGDRIQIGATVLRFSLLDKFDDEVHQRLYDASVRDPLTRAFNRRFFDGVLPKEFAFAERHDTPLSLLMIDIDHFKNVNDKFGHQAGDAALAAVSASLTQGIRSEDVLARYGGEEFALVLRELTEEVAIAVADRLREHVARLDPRVTGISAPLSVSIGVATHLKGVFQSEHHLLAAADQYLFAAKSRGRNRVCSRPKG